MTKKIVIAVVVLILGIWLWGKVRNRTSLIPKKPVTASVVEGWTEVTDSAVALKIEKSVTAGLKPQIVLIKSSSKDATNPAKYVDRLIAGARSTLASFRVSEDKREQKDGVYLAKISGYYLNQKKKVSLIQRIYIKGEQIETLTASFSGDIAAEIESALDKIEKEKIN